MPLPTQQWRFVGAAGFYASSVTTLLDAIYALGTASTYADGSSRTQGSGSAATFSRYQNSSVTEAVYCTPATTTSLEARFIWAGVASGSPSPTMASPDSFSAGMLMVGINKDSGSFNAWDNASPFTSGSFHGYYNVWGSSESHAQRVYMYECQEAVYLVIVRSNGTTRHCCVGAFVDPGSTNTSDAESDGRLYGVYTSGGNQVVTNMFGNPTSAGAWMGNSTSGNQQHFSCFRPYNSSLFLLERNGSLQDSASGIGRLSSGGYRYFGGNIPVVRDESPNNLVGTLRDMAFFEYGMTGTRLVSDGVVTGHVIGERSSTDEETVLLLRNA